MIASIKSLLITIIYQPLYNLLFIFIWLLPGQSLGLGIIAITALIRILLMPLSAQSVRAQREMSAIQPEMDKIRKEYKDKPEELNKKIIALYQEHNVNPLRSCLPMLIQLPILIILYRVFLNFQPINESLIYSFVSIPEQLSTSLFGIDLTVQAVTFSPNLVINGGIILALVAGAFQFIQTRQLMSQRKNQEKEKKAEDNKKKDNKEDATKIAQQLSGKMMYFMPIFTVVIAMTLPSALALYWTISNAFSILQQWWLFKTKPAIATPHISVSVKGTTKSKK